MTVCRATHFVRLIKDHPSPSLLRTAWYEKIDMPDNTGYYLSNVRSGRCPMTSKKVDTKQRILDISLELFSKKGFGNVSIRDIARAAETPIPNIYYYFGNKKGLYTYLLRDIMTRFAASISEADRGCSIRERLVNMGKAKHRFIAQNPNIMRLLFWERIGSESSAMEEIGSIVSGFTVTIAGMISGGISSGEFRQVDPGLATRFLLGVFNTYDIEMASLGRIPSDDETEAVVDLALEALKNR